MICPAARLARNVLIAPSFHSLPIALEIGGIARKWARQAEADLASAKALLAGGQYYASAFFSQQAAEKCFKAACIMNGLGLLRSHDLLLLGKRAGAPDKLVQKSGALNAHYAETRYPDYEDEIPAESYSREEAEGAFKVASEVLEWAKKKTGA